MIQYTESVTVSKKPKKAKTKVDTLGGDSEVDVEVDVEVDR